MEVLRDTDGSVTFTFSGRELKRIRRGRLEVDVDGLAWKNLASFFISTAQGHDPEFAAREHLEAHEGFSLVEDFDEQGITIGYTALRHPPLESAATELPSVRFPKVGSELSHTELESINHPDRLTEKVPEPIFADVA